MARPDDRQPHPWSQAWLQVSPGTAVSLSSGIDCYFSITDDGADPSGSKGMFRTNPNDGMPLFFRSGDSGSRGQSSNNVTFELHDDPGPVPEPTSLTPLLPGSTGYRASLTSRLYDYRGRCNAEELQLAVRYVPPWPKSLYTP